MFKTTLQINRKYNMKSKINKKYGTIANKHINLDVPQDILRLKTAKKYCRRMIQSSIALRKVKNQNQKFKYVFNYIHKTKQIKQNSEIKTNRYNKIFNMILNNKYKNKYTTLK